MKFDLEPVTEAHVGRAARPWKHLRAHPLDGDARLVGIWRLAPVALCGEEAVVPVPTGRAVHGCSTCDEYAAIIETSVIAFERYRTRLLAGGGERR